MERLLVWRIAQEMRGFRIDLPIVSSSQRFNVGSIEANDIDMVLLEEIGISYPVAVALMVGTVDFNRTEVTLRNRSNPPSKQAKLAFRFLVGALQTTRKSPKQQIYATMTKPNFYLRMKTCFPQ
jgi:hypothetical protein